MGDDGAVRVALRIRPLLQKETLEGASVCIRPATEGSAQVIMGSDRPFTFDAVFDRECPQEPVFDEVVVPLVDACFSGYNATVLAYGQTGSGKTYTMGSGSLAGTMEEQVGIIPRVITTIFNRMQAIRERVVGAEFRVKVQFIEIYGESIRDLLDPTPDGHTLPIREVEDGTVQLIGVTEEEVPSAHHLMQSLERGSLARTTASTMMNAHSSRSHAIFTVIMEQNLPEGGEDADTGAGAGDGEAGDDGGESKAPPTETVTEKRTSKFHFVDLAGSERAKRTQAVGQRLKEGIHINKGLLALGNVISALGDVKKRGKVHVPYRDSKLTRMLQDSLGGNSKTLMVACVSPADTNFDETLNTLKYANRARNIKNKPIVNRDRNASQIATLKREIAKLKQQIVNGPAEDYERLRERWRTADADVRRLNTVTKQLRRHLDARTEEKLELQSKFEQLRVLFQQETGKEAPIQEVVPRDVAQLMGAAGASPASVKMDDEACRDVSSGVPLETIRKYLTQIQALRDQVASTQRELAEAKTTISKAGLDGDDDDDEDEEQFAAATGDWLNAQQQDTSASLDDIITRLSFGSHNSPLVKLARANLIKRRSPAARAVAARIIAETKQAADEDGISDTEVALATGEALAEVEVQFEKKHGEMVKTMRSLSDDIKMKESAMVRQSKMFASMRKLYETKMAQMDKQMRMTVQQRDKLQAQIQNLGSNVVAEKKRLKEKLMSKLRNTEKQLDMLKRKQAEFEKLKRLQARAKQRLREVQQELHNMKRMRVSQQRALEQVKKDFRNKVLIKSREILSLRREANKERSLLRKLQTQEAKRDMVLKRRMEDLAAQNRRLKDAQKRNRRISEAARRTAKVASRARAASAAAGGRRRRGRGKDSKDTAAIKQKLEEAIKTVAAKEQKNAELRKKLESRDRDLRMMEELLEQRRALVSDLDMGDGEDDLQSDIHAFFGSESPSAGAGAGVGAGAAAGKGAAAPANPVDGLSADIAAYFQPDSGEGEAASAQPAPAAKAEPSAAPSTPDGKEGVPLSAILVNGTPGKAPQSAKRREITVAEAEALEELEERIEGTEARLRYNTELIEKQLGGNGGAEGEQARAGADGSAGRDEEEEDDEDPSIATVATLDEAKGVMRVLFGMVVEAKNTERSKHSEVENLKLRLQETERELEGACDTMRLLKQQHERQLAMQEAEHAQEQAVLMSVAAAGEDGDDDDDADNDNDDDEQSDDTPGAAQIRAEYQELQARNQTLEQELAVAKRELAKAQAEVASASRAARSAVTTVKRRRSGNDISHRTRARRSRGQSTGSRASRDSAGSVDATRADGERPTGASADNGADADIWQNGSGADGGDEGQAPAPTGKKRSSTGKGGKAVTGSRRSLRGNSRRLHPPAARSRHSLGGRTTSLRRPRTAPVRDAASGSNAAAAATTATAASTGGGSDDEFSNETWRSAGDALAKPLPHMNVFSRLSDYRSFTGTHRATHATIALGRNEYHNTDNNMFRRAKPKVKKAWSSSLRSTDDEATAAAAAAGATTTRRRRDGDKPAVFGRLADVRNFTGTHKHKHEELLQKVKGDGKAKSRSGGEEADGSDHGSRRRRSGSAGSTGEQFDQADDDDAAQADSAASPKSPALLAMRKVGKATPEQSPIRLNLSPAADGEDGTDGDANGAPVSPSVRQDPLGTTRLVDLLGSAPRPSTPGDHRPFRDAVSPHLNVEEGHSERMDRVRRGRSKARARAKARQGRSASYSPPLSPVAQQDLSTLVEEPVDGDVSLIEPSDGPREQAVAPLAAVEDPFANIDLTGLEVPTEAVPLADGNAADHGVFADASTSQPQTSKRTAAHTAGEGNKRDTVAGRMKARLRAEAAESAGKENDVTV